MVQLGQPLVELRNVSMAYGQGANAVKAVDNLTLTIKKGEFIAVVGPSGCGKSSMMKLISGLKPTSEGSLTIEGQPVQGPPHPSRQSGSRGLPCVWQTCKTGRR